MTSISTLFIPLNTFLTSKNEKCLLHPCVVSFSIESFYLAEHKKCKTDVNNEAVTHGSNMCVNVMGKFSCALSYLN